MFERAHIPVLYSGVGKINAAIALSRLLTRYRVSGNTMPQVVNFGTAGSRQLKTGTFAACNEFVQRDMDACSLGMELGVTPFENMPSKLTFPVVFRELPQAICGTGDSFDVSPSRLTCGLVDMEAYAFAKVCVLEQARFACAKYITDGADHSSARDWKDNLHRAAAGFYELYRSTGLQAVR